MRNKILDVIYDAQCRFCLRSLRLLERVAGRRLFRLHNGNDRELMQSKFPMLAGADINNAMFAVTSRGEVFRGFFAFRRIMRESPRLYPFLPLFYAPGAALIGPRIYAWVAKNRRNFGCSLDGTKVCSIGPRRDGIANPDDVQTERP
jgi:predicted DCC family thiol-disulfide oxidoreductase YuxK